MNSSESYRDSTILIIDDEPSNLHLLSELLTRRGHKTRLVPNGHRALSSIEKSIPDLILLDILMPEMDGYEVCRRLKADERTRDIPIIFISALDEVFDKVKAFKLGGVDYITKPFNEAEVFARVQTHLSIQQMFRQIQEQNQELEAFARTVAHDLKNPLATLTGYSSMLEDEIGDIQNETLQQCIEGISKNSFRMGRIIDELILLSKIRKEQVEMAPIDMAVVITEVLESLELTIERYSGKVSLPQSWETALGYAPWVEEVWVNYITNGLKYGGQPPHLELGSSQQEDGMVRFWIRDHGDGLTPEEQAVLFTEFTQLGEVRFSGHGLGLSIVKRIITKLGGDVGIESRGLQGKGSLFYFTLPAAEINPHEE